MMPRLAAALVAALAFATPLSAARASAPAADALAAAGAWGTAAPAATEAPVPTDTLAVPAAPLPGRPAPALAPRAAAPSPFPVVPLEARAPRRSHLGSWLALAAGAGLVGASFAIAERADRSYDAYLRATEPDEIERLYDETLHRDRLASATLVGGEVLVATAVWLRFLRDPRPPRLSLLVGADRCALSLRY